MEKWFEHAALAAFAALVAAIVAGGSILLTVIFLCQWAVATLPAEIAFPTILLGFILVAGAAAFAGHKAAEHRRRAKEPRDAISTLAALIPAEYARMGAARPATLVLESFVLGLLISSKHNQAIHPHS